MGRPKATAERVPVDRRLANAFWMLLETHTLGEITIGMVAGAAGVNRGTFYYHFANLDDFVYRVIELELVGERALLRDIFAIAIGSDATIEGIASVEGKMRRMGLALAHGGMDAMGPKIKEVLAGMWQALLRPDGSRINPQTRAVIEYATSGVIGMLSYFASQDEGAVDVGPGMQEFLKNSACFMLASICKAEGVPQEAVLERLAAANGFDAAGRALSAAAPSRRTATWSGTALP